MGVVDAHALADDLGAFGVLLVVLQAHLVERVKDAPVHGLQTVAGIGQRPAYDDAHRVVEIRAAHLLFNVDGNEVGAAIGRRAAFEGEHGILIVSHKVFLSPPKGAKINLERVRNEQSRPGADCTSILFLEEGFSKANIGK